MTIVYNPFTNNLDYVGSGSGGSGIETIDGDEGSVTGSTVTISGGTTGLKTSGSSTTMDLTGTLGVANGGTDAVSFTTYAPICGGITTTGALQSADTGIGTSGYVLTSTGATSLPTWQAGGGGGGIVTIDDDFSGSATGSTVTFDANTNCGSSVSFQASGAAVDLFVTDANNNTIIGSGSGNGSISGTSNTSLGYQTLASAGAATNCTAIGSGSLNGLGGNDGATAVGAAALNAGFGERNTAIG